MPWLNQKHLLNGHSHFAFIAWVSFCAMLYMARMVLGDIAWPAAVGRFFGIYIINAWLMLLAFVLTGYGGISITLFMLHVLLCVWFFRWWYRSAKLHTSVHTYRLISMALGFNLLSFVGTLVLAYLMYSKTGSMYTKQNTLYVFLHYQYNGYFIFACLGIATHYFKPQRYLGLLNYGIISYTLATFTGLGLLLLMHKKPIGLVVLNSFTAVLLMVSVILIVIPLLASWVKSRAEFNPISAGLLLLSLCGLLLKTLLQSLSAHPDVAFLVYEHRSIAIGYLHLVFLIIVTFFLMAVFLRNVKINKTGQLGLVIFVSAALLNEIVLGLQGFGAILHVLVPYTNRFLIGLTGFMAIGLGLLSSALCRLNPVLDK
jgi:hypothetical protein